MAEITVNDNTDKIEVTVDDISFNIFKTLMATYIPALSDHFTSNDYNNLASSVIFLKSSKYRKEVAEILRTKLERFYNSFLTARSKQYNYKEQIKDCMFIIKMLKQVEDEDVLTNTKNQDDNIQQLKRQRRNQSL